jgi:hypothetical protein
MIERRVVSVFITKTVPEYVPVKQRKAVNQITYTIGISLAWLFLLISAAAPGGACTALKIKGWLIGGSS